MKIHISTALAEVAQVGRVSERRSLKEMAGPSIWYGPAQHQSIYMPEIQLGIIHIKVHQ